MRPEDVPAGPLLVDTDVFSWVAWRRGRHDEFSELIRGHVVVISFATVGELYAGAERARWSDARRERLESIIDRYVILPATGPVTTMWGRLYARFKDQVDQNDLWIAACALAQSNPLPIVTGNLIHFQRVGSEFPLRIVHPDL